MGSKNNWCLCGTGLVGLLLAIVSVSVWFALPSIVDSQIEKQVVLKEGTPMMEKWLNIPVDVYLQIYFFNYTNAMDVLEMEKDAWVEEVGPYVFRLDRKREIDKDQSNETTMKYYETRSYEFQEEMTRSLSNKNLTLNDSLTTLNLVYLALGHATRQVPIMAKLMSKGLVNSTFFSQCTIYQLLFEGCLSESEKATLGQAVKQLNKNSIQLSILVNNATDSYEIYTGTDDVSKLGEMTWWQGFKGTRRMPNPPWGNKNCSVTNGTDGTIFPPNLKKDRPLYIFSQDICRSLKMSYLKTVENKYFELYRYTLAEEVLEPDLEQNQCFCTDARDCLTRKGVVEIGKCKDEVPLALSLPHFEKADCKYLGPIDGLQQGLDEHTLHIDIEPKLGIPMKANVRLQINYRFQKENKEVFKDLGNVSRALYPVLWMNQKVDISEKLLEEVYHMMAYKLKVARITLIVALIVGLLLMAGAIAFRFATKSRSQETMVMEDFRYKR